MQERPGQPAYTIVKNPRKKSKRNDILDAAMKTFCHYGYDGASMSMIAEEAGVSKGIINKYFISKDKLFSLCLKNFTDVFTKRIFDNLSQEGMTFDKHTDYLFGLFTEFRPQLRLLMSTILTPSHEETGREIVVRHFEEIAPLLERFDGENKQYFQLNYIENSMLMSYVIGGNKENYRNARGLMHDLLKDKTD